MEGSSTKETNGINSNVESQNVTYTSAPPPYQQTYPYPPQQPVYSPQQPGYPHQQEGTVIAPGVIVTQPPGMIVTQQGLRGPVTTTVVGNTIVQTTVIDSTVGSMPSLVRCRSCNHQMVTRVEYTPTTRTHLAALCLCLFVMWPCACLPYCMSSCQAANHYCTNCGAFVGSY